MVLIVSSGECKGSTFTLVSHFLKYQYNQWVTIMISLSGNNSPLPQLSVAALSPLKALPREGTPPHKGTSPQLRLGSISINRFQPSLE